MKAFSARFGFFLFSLIFLSYPLVAKADGVLIDPNQGHYDLYQEDAQQALISYENGLEKMVIATSVKPNDQSGVVWLFPIPANPENVKLDVLNSMPNLSGIDLFYQAKKNVTDVRDFVNGFEIYPGLFSTKMVANSTKNTQDSMSTLGVEEKTPLDVRTYEHLEKGGIISEIITAKTKDGLTGYFAARNLNIEPENLTTLQDYIGQDYSFIASWLSAINIPQTITNDAGTAIPAPSKFKTVTRGLAVTFPTDKIFFPLKPTGAYQNRIVPAVVKVIGLTTPEIYKEIKPYTKVSYFTNAYLPLTDSDVYFRQDRSVSYTKVEINSPSSAYIDDLWIKNQVPTNVSYIAAWAKNINSDSLSGIVLIVLLVLIFSYLAAIIAGLICFAEIRNRKIFRFALIGSFNALSILGLIVAAAFWRTKTIKPEDKELFEELKRRGYSAGAIEARDWRKFLFIPIFSILFVFLVWAVAGLFLLTLA